MNGVSEVNVAKWKVSKRTLKISPIHIWVGGCVSVCVFVYLSVCLYWLKSWITFDWMKGSWRNFQDQPNYVLQVIFEQGCQISQPQGCGPRPKRLVSRKSISSPSFCPFGVWHTFLETLGPGLKSLGRGILNFGVGPKILGPEWAGTCQKNIFLEFWVFT